MKKIQYYILTKSIGLYLNVLSYINLDAAKNKAYQLFSKPRKGKLKKEKLPKTLQNVTYETFEFQTEKFQTYIWNGTRGEAKRSEANEEVILLVHGWESNAGSLGAFVKLLNENDYKVIAFDCPAHGQSGGKQTTLFKNSDAALLICNQIGHIDLAITHSFGSVVLMNAILHNKD